MKSLKNRERQKQRQTTWATWNHNAVGEQWPQKSYCIEKSYSNQGAQEKVQAVDELVQKHWAQLNPEVQQAFHAVGLGVKEETKEPDLKEILMSHFSELPADSKAKVESIVHPKEPVTEQTEAAKLKQSVGQLRDLTKKKKKQVQPKMNSYKEMYKATLNELQENQNDIEKVQKTLKDLTDSYAKLIEDVTAESESQDTLLGLPTMMQLLTKAGVNCSDEQKEQNACRSWWRRTTTRSAE